jgi:uridine kinase
MRPKLIAIAGGSGSGKSWLAERLQALLSGEAQRLSLDAFYLDRSHLPPGRRARINYDHPRCIDWPLVRSALENLKAGRSVRVPRYDFASHSRAAETDVLEPTPVLLVEGLWLLRRNEVRRLFDLSIFLDCPSALRLTWRMARDTIARGRTEESVRGQFRATVAPMHSLYVAPQRRHADLVLRQPLDGESVDELVDRLRATLFADAISTPEKRAAICAKARALMLGEGL